MSAARPLRIGMLLDAPFPPDPRVAQEARTLLDDGHAVHLFCLDWSGRPARETIDGLEIHRHPMSKTFHDKAGALALNLPLYRAWFRRRLRPFLRRLAIDVLHVHDLPLARAGLAAAREQSLPLVLDLHENFPAALRTYGYARTLPGRLLIWPSAWERYERRMARRADRLIVVIEEAAQRLQELGIPPAKIAVVPNTVDHERFRAFRRDAAVRARLDPQRYRVLYTGGFDEHRGLDTALAAVEAAARENRSLELVLVGAGRNRPRLEQEARRRGLARHVRFEGWRPFETFPTYIEASQVGLIPHRKTAHTDTTIPHKLFHYMSLGLPVVVTDCAPLQRIVTETGAGIVVPHSDPAAMAAALDRLRHPELRREMGDRGRRAVETTYHWNRTAAPLRALYHGLSVRDGPGAAEDAPR
ncbi:MAG: glycosyltransferase [Candidatus Eisenbacteria bacterium]|nr:glycosyltransferase [Candidatus Eisenbacteria bacterium]